MMLFESLSVISVMGIMYVITWTMTKIMNGLTSWGVGFIPAAWLTTAWGIVAFLASATFLLSLLQLFTGLAV